MKAITYKGQYARIEFDAEERILSGRLAGIRDVVAFHSETATGIISAFHEAVDTYLDACARAGKDPERAVSGNIMLRVDPALHARVARAAELSGLSVNQWSAEVFDLAADEIIKRAVQT